MSVSRQERRCEIGTLINEAMKKVEGVDWTKDTPEIVKAEAELNNVVTQYIEGATSKEDVKAVYQRWRDLHKTGELFG